MKHLWIILFSCLSLLSATAQNSIFDKITLLTGEVYVGDIVVKTEDMIMIKTITGAKYQFRTSQIKSVEKTSQTFIEAHETENNSTDKLFCAQIELGAGLLNAPHAFGTAPTGEIDFSIGHKKVINEHFFVGLGSGYSIIYISDKQSTTSMVPLYIRLRHTFSPGKTSPFVGTDCGYSFGSDSKYKGGILFRINAGISTPLNYKSLFFASLSAGLQQMQTHYTIQNEFGTYNDFGYRTNFAAGIKAGIQF